MPVGRIYARRFSTGDPVTGFVDVEAVTADPNGVLSRRGGSLAMLVGATTPTVPVAFYFCLGGTSWITVWSTVPGGSIGGIIAWGANNVLSTITTRYLWPYYDNSAALITPVYVTAPRAGRIRSLFVRHNTAPGNANLIVYTLRVNDVASALSVSLAANSIGPASDTTDSVLVAAGDRLDIEVTKAVDVGSSPQQITAMAEYT